MQADMLGQAARAIAAIVQDYRADDGIEMNPDRVLAWAKQFEPQDQLFVLQETRRILKKRYFSKRRTEQFLRESIEQFAGEFGYNTVPDFLLDTVFLDLQEPGKSQKHMLRMLDDLIQAEYSIDLAVCGADNSRNLIYLDDILCTANTVFFDLEHWLKDPQAGSQRVQAIQAGECRLMLLYIFVHALNENKLLYRLKGKDIPIADHLEIWREVTVDNNYRDFNSALETILPLQEGQSQQVLDYYTDKRLAWNSKGEGNQGVFRETHQPPTETFFSSPENRIRY